MAEAWTLFALMFVTTAAIRASGPVALGGRDLPVRVAAVIGLLAPALLAALVLTQTFAGEGGSGLEVDERAVGVAGAGAVMALKGSVLIALGVAVALTAGARAVL
ncbi:hypothetical protein BH20ACT15_BH20ACT15_03430 [soil metagenome]